MAGKTHHAHAVHLFDGVGAGVRGLAVGGLRSSGIQFALVELHRARFIIGGAGEGHPQVAQGAGAQAQRQAAGRWVWGT